MPWGSSREHQGSRQILPKRLFGIRLRGRVLFRRPERIDECHGLIHKHLSTFRSDGVAFDDGAYSLRPGRRVRLGDTNRVRPVE